MLTEAVNAHCALCGGLTVLFDLIEANARLYIKYKDPLQLVKVSHLGGIPLKLIALL